MTLPANPPETNPYRPSATVVRRSWMQQSHNDEDVQLMQAGAWDRGFAAGRVAERDALLTDEAADRLARAWWEYLPAMGPWDDTPDAVKREGRTAAARALAALVERADPEGDTTDG